jgi:Flp pilus assembly protein TadG
MTRWKSRRGGATFLEFTLVGIPMIFVMISVFEIARGMWIYHTLAYAVKEATRYAIVHGKGCATEPNACTVTIGQIAGKIRNSGVGLLPQDLSVTLESANSSVVCSTMTTCLNSNTIWPDEGGNAPGQPITITVSYPFRSALSMFWPGSGPVSFGVFTFPATSQETIQF